MYILNQDEISLVSGGFGEVNFLDLAALWSGYNGLSFLTTVLVGTIGGAIAGGIGGIPTGIASLAGGNPRLAVATPVALGTLGAVVGGVVTALEYGIGSYAASCVNVSKAA